MSETRTRTNDGSLDEQLVWEALQTVPDPELPAISVVDMGIIRRIDIDEASSSIRVVITPTFSGCPALSQIQTSIAEKLRSLAKDVEVAVTMQQPWTSDMLSASARQKLSKVGIAPPPHVGRGPLLPMLTQHPLTCPHCGSQQTMLENPFGPTPCRAIAYCQHCHQPFEQFKPI
ncbi:1,2-phenylacetyl-CoA epoxidase subunit PaaD [Dictyobacter aurantiacus]|uniref:Phenylacetate-CoA oxygenase subunit PaaJ n=1 Tax=Dictyobacter aurantiacus TaxID=1936993 RepID=A0A401ZI38_9CHLR|nr:1,2-phenylacetyl-CoA epoxidase subunit PaaD [Dictyobacter aurantiacus]GCE06504.1 phenylacetate-CoA oxygenase subunit PaaJ [Dictyobacter aurantiacus]